MHQYRNTDALMDNVGVGVGVGVGVDVLYVLLGVNVSRPISFSLCLKSLNRIRTFFMPDILLTCLVTLIYLPKCPQRYKPSNFLIL